MKIAFVPIDNRPVCYTLPRLIAQIDEDISFSIPKRELLGDLNKSANIPALFDWLQNLPKQDVIILSLDTLIYGGLIPSRRCHEDFTQIKARVDKLREILVNNKAKIYATSSIMRISNNNYNEEEKEYWAQYGTKIFKYSYELHKNGVAKTDVPDEILEDYMKTRQRNFEINKLLLDFGLFETLVFSKDDCAQYGFNVMEASELEKLGGFVKTGADEIPLSLLARAINKNIKICPIFIEPKSKDLISNYEDVSIEKSVLGQISLAGCEVSSEEDADILLYVNNFKNHQGEIVMNVDTEMFEGKFILPNKPYMIADVRFANGADNNFVQSFLKNNFDENFYGYSAWNTSANTLGSLICAAKVKYCAKKFSQLNFKKLQITRFLDDWGYQANARQQLKMLKNTDIRELMKPYADLICQKLDYYPKLCYSFPWNRLFEVEIEFN